MVLVSRASERSRSLSGLAWKALPLAAGLTERPRSPCLRLCHAQWASSTRCRLGEGSLQSPVDGDAAQIEADDGAEGCPNLRPRSVLSAVCSRQESNLLTRDEVRHRLN